MNTTYKEHAKSLEKERISLLDTSVIDRWMGNESPADYSDWNPVMEAYIKYENVRFVSLVKMGCMSCEMEEIKQEGCPDIPRINPKVITQKPRLISRLIKCIQVYNEIKPLIISKYKS